MLCSMKGKSRKTKGLCSFGGCFLNGGSRLFNAVVAQLVEQRSCDAQLVPSARKGMQVQILSTAYGMVDQVV